jgi:hypothetical protein
MYITSKLITVIELQSIGAACILIATKFCESFALPIDSLTYLSMDAFTREELESREVDILLVLDWKIHVKTSFHYFQELCSEGRNLQILGVKLLFLMQTDPKLYQFPPLEMAIAVYICAQYSQAVPLDLDLDLIGNKHVVRECIQRLGIFLTYKVPFLI